MTAPTSIYDAVAPFGLSAEECFQEYSSFLTISSRIVGASLTKFASVAHSSPLTIRPYMGALRPLIRAPNCDFGMAAVSPRQRRLLMLTSSTIHGCVFCTAHTACMGDALSGSTIQQCFRAGKVLNEDEQKGDPEIQQLVKEVCSFPAIVTPDTKKRFVDLFGKPAFMEAASILSFMAWLNYVMDAIGVSLESEIAPFAQLVLTPRSLPFDVTDIAAGDSDEEFGKERARVLLSGEASALWSRIRAHLTNAWDFVTMLPKIYRANATANAWYRGLPSTIKEIDLWRKNEFGCHLRFDQHMDIDEVKRALSFVLREVFLKDENSKWTRSEKFALLFAFAKGVDNKIILEDAIALSIADKVKDDYSSSQSGSATDAEGRSMELIAADVRKQLEEVAIVAKSEEKASDAFSAAAKLVYAAAGPAGHVAKSGTPQDFLAHVDQTGCRMDVMGMIGTFAMMHRMSVMCGAE